MERDNADFLARAKECGAAHVLNVCDSFDYEHYPVFVMPDESLEKKLAEYREGKHPMQRVYAVLTVPATGLEK